MISNELLKLLVPPMNPDELGIPINIINDIIFRIIFNEGEASVVRVAEVMGVHARVIDLQLSRMKQEHLVEVTKAGSLGSLSFTYTLTEAGGKRARDAFERSQYVGRVPVTIDQYTKAILLQAQNKVHVSPEQVKTSLSHLILPAHFHRKIGPAVNSGTSLFLYGPPGNGKTTIAEALGKILSSGDPIWLPDALTAGGQVIRVFDPLLHIPIKEDEISTQLGMTGNTDKLKIDKRWRLFERPAVMVGGELTMDSLDLRYEPIAKVYEAPLQLKANGGMLLIDDFGRQQISPQQLLNRWIVPLESKVDFLRLQSGQTIEIPFRQFIVFSTNLDPGDLVDGAFLRRIQMKVEVGGPDERLFYQIFLTACKSYNVPLEKNAFMHLLQRWYRQPQRVMQAVHPRDIVKTVVSICDYEKVPPKLSPDLLDEACDTYFVDTLKDTGKTMANM
ncbi:MAG: ATP-binding protein [Anaerolineales bacterium]|nr:ATP-binding protein [Anaerolineales bacterium]